MKWLTLSSASPPPLILLVRIDGIGVSGLARFVILLFALSLASEARRRMRGVERWGRHLRSGSRAATKEVLALTHYRRASDQTKAREHLTTATAMYREMGMTFWLEKADAALGGVER